jgi:hypothetical protein
MQITWKSLNRRQQDYLRFSVLTPPDIASLMPSGERAPAKGVIHAIDQPSSD